MPRGRVEFYRAKDPSVMADTVFERQELCRDGGIFVWVFQGTRTRVSGVLGTLMTSKNIKFPTFMARTTTDLMGIVAEDARRVAGRRSRVLIADANMLPSHTLNQVVGELVGKGIDVSIFGRRCLTR